MVTSSFRFLAASLIVLCGSTGALAQPAKITDVRTNARTKLGPIYFSPLLVIDNIGIDDNVFLDPDTGERRSDFRVSVTPVMRAWLPLATRALISGTMGSEIVYYHRYSSERAVNPDVAADLDVFFGRLSVYGGYGFQHAKSRPNLEIDERAVHRLRTSRAGMTYEIGPMLSLDVSMSQAATRFDANEVFLSVPLSITLDRDQRDIQTALSYTLTPKTTIYTRVAHNKIGFLLSPNRDAEGFRIAPGVRFAASALISGSAELGLRTYRPAHPSVPSYAGPVGAAELSYDLLGATRLTMRFDRDVQQSFEVRHPYYLREVVGARVRRQIAGRFDLIVGVDRADHEYRHFNENTSTVRREDRFWAYTGDLGFRLTRLARVGLVASTSTRTSNEETGRQYGRLSVGFALTYGS